MPSGRRARKTSIAFLEVAAAWVLAGIALAAVALLPLHEAGGPADRPLNAKFITHFHPLHVTSGCEDREPLEACDPNVNDEAPGMPSAHARATTPAIGPDDRGEGDQC
jgi:hypothetical protein